MPSERIQRRIDALLDEADEAISAGDWSRAKDRALDALALDAENADAGTILAAAQTRTTVQESATTIDTPAAGSPVSGVSAQPTSFANGRYTVKRFLGEGGKKKVYLAHDALLDRDVAFALIKTEGLDEASRTRITREAQAMGRLGDHPNIVTVYDIGEENGAPYMVLPVLGGGDVEGVIEKAPEHRMPLEQALKIAVETCRGLEFAHGKGIVHRDLKPGNVWLSEDGTAKIGDFGLAVATDRSRLTQAGMMVGTVSYMPPEQAMGGEVGPRSDLYSLGAMLYEMVCGRPPFVGDESVAIIGQHLNTPPVAPTWHRPDCPAALDALILRLLEKDPNRRPGSATDVREALEAVGTSAAPRQATVAQETPSAGENPLYRRTFVGRENEVKQLQAAFDAALSGQGGLVMVVGEPGIGKTALCEQLATYVALRGGKALVGHCYEEGSLSLPYLAFVEAMRSYVLAREPDGLRSDLGTGAADVARIVSEVRDRVQGVELRPVGDPEDDRWRLLQSVTSFLRNASSVQPLVIVLEDLHWADRGTLDLLLHVARNLQGARLLIVGNYRDVEVDRTHPLSGVLADLRRINSFASVRLRGLTVDEVHRMYETLRGNTVPWGQAEAVYRATEGNPLFVQEVLRYLVEEGFVAREGGRYVAQQGVGAGIPEGLRDVVGKRLSRLSEKTNQLLAIAAVMGRDFRLDVLQQVAALPEEELYSALAESVERAVVEERSGLGAAVAYRFAHAFFRQTLYEETIAPRRIRLHQQVARALESVYGRRLEEHAAELAEHYSYSSTPNDLKKAVEYGELAARRATSVFDYGEAERHLQQALNVQEVLDPDDKVKRCDLLLALGEVMLPQPNPLRVLKAAANEAYDLAEAMGDWQRCTRSALQARMALVLGAGTQAWQSVEVQLWLERIDQQARPETSERVLADLALATSLLTGPVSTVSEGHSQIMRAFELASRLDDNSAYFQAALGCLSHLITVRDQDVRLQLARQLIVRPHDGVTSRTIARCLIQAGATLLSGGERDLAERVWREATQLANNIGDVNVRVEALAPAIILAYMDGDIGKAISLARSARELALATGVSTMIVPKADRHRTDLGEVSDELAAAYDEFPAGLRIAQAMKAVILAKLGRHSEARAIIDNLGDLGSDANSSGQHVLTNSFEASILGEDVERIRALSRRFTPLSRYLAVGVAPWWPLGVSIGRLLGSAARILGQPDEARRFYDDALEVCERTRIRPELALTRLGLAELLLEHYPDERAAAIEHLDFAIGELREMKMQPALERALRHRGLLKA